jgi:hypothetical protein
VAKTESAAAMDEAQAQLRPFLEERGYRLRTRTCNRKSIDGLTHVLNFQMGQRFLQGKFTVNLGVNVPEVWRTEFESEPRPFVNEAECCIRRRLGTLGPDRRDQWWKLPLGDSGMADLKLRLERDAFPFFARFQTRDSILSELGPLKGNSGAGMPNRIVCAILLAHRGEKEEAKKMLASQIREVANPGHARYVESLSDRLGLGRIET